MAKQKKERIVYYNDEAKDEFSTAKIKAIKIDASYRYGHLTPLFSLIRFLYYRVFAMPIAFIYLKLKWHHRIINKKEVFSALKSYTLSSSPNIRRLPIFIYGNHTNPIADALIPTFLSFPKSTFVIVHAANVSIPFLGQSTKYLGALPLPSDMAAAKNFNAAIEERLERASSICIYPEAHIWPYCTWIRNFPDLSFRYPVQYNVPVICFTNTYNYSSRGVSMTTYVDGPFFPDATLTHKEQRKVLRDAVYNAMVMQSRKSDAVLVRYVKADNEAQNAAIVRQEKDSE